MKHLAKRTLSLLLAALMVLTIIPAQPLHAHADDNTNVASVVASGVKDPAKQTCTNASIKNYGTLGVNTTPPAMNLKANGAFLTISLLDGFMSTFNNKAYIEVAYYTAGSGDITVEYTTTSNTVKAATILETTDGTVENTKIKRYRVTDAAFVNATANKGGGINITSSATSGVVYIYSVTITMISDEQTYAPEFNTSSIIGDQFDEMKDALKVTNNNANDMTVTGTMTINRISGEDVTQMATKTIETTKPVTVPASTRDVAIWDSGTIFNATKSAGTYKLILNLTATVGEKTYTVQEEHDIKRYITFIRQLSVDNNGDLLLDYQMQSGEKYATVIPTKFKVFLQRNSDKVIRHTYEITDLTSKKADRKNLTALLKAHIEALKKNAAEGVTVAELEEGELYTVAVQAYNGNTPRATSQTTYTYGDYPVFSTYVEKLYDNRNPQAITIQNIGEAKTVKVQLTIWGDGEALHTEEWSGVSIGGKDAADGSDKQTVASDSYLKGYMMENGVYKCENYTITLTVYWGAGDAGHIFTKTYTTKPASSTEQKLYMEDGDMIFDVLRNTGAHNYAPDLYKVIFTEVVESTPAPVDENGTESGETTEPGTGTGDDEATTPTDLTFIVEYVNDKYVQTNLTEKFATALEKEKTYNVTVEGYRYADEEKTTLETTPRTTISFENYIYTDMVPEFNSDTFTMLFDEIEATATLEMSNPSETDTMAYVLDLTITDGTNTKTGTVQSPEDSPVEAGKKAKIAGPESYRTAVKGYGKYQFTVEGTVTIGEKTYPVYHTFSFERRATFTHKFEESSSGALQFGVQKVAGGEKYAPDKFAIEVIRKATAEGEKDVVVYSKDATSLPYDTYHDLTNLMNENNVVDGKYDVVIKAYAGEVLRKTITATDYYKCTVHTPSGEATCQETTTCADCGRTVKGKHQDTNEDGKCDVVVSGEGDQTVYCDHICAHKGAYVALNGTMDYNILIPEGAASAVVRSDGKKLGNVTIGDNNGTPVIIVPGLAAKELCETFYVELYDAEGKKIGEFTESFADYVTRAFASEDEKVQKSWPLIADMVTYVAEAQKHFNYKTERLVTNMVDCTGKGGTATEYVFEATTDRPEDVSGKYFGTSFVLEKHIIMKMYVKGATYCEYTIYDGETETSGTCYGVKNNGYNGFSFDNFVTKHGKDGVYVVATFYDKDTEDKQVITTVTDSMAQYAARAVEKNDSNRTVLSAMMNYVTAAWNYFNSATNK